MKKTLLIVLLSFSLTVSAFACKCGDTKTVEDEFTARSLIVHGKILHQELVSFKETARPDKVDQIRENLKDESLIRLFESDHIVQITLLIIDSYKGSGSADTVTLYTPKDSASCGFRFETGKEYIIYASPHNYTFAMFFANSSPLTSTAKPNTYWTSQCSRTKPYEKQEATILKRLKRN